MPLWTAAYFAGYLVFAIWTLRDDFKEDRSIGFITAQVASDLALLVSALSFWLEGMSALPRAFIVGLFVLGLSIFLLQAVNEVRRLFPDPELSHWEDVGVAIAGTGLALLVTAPLAYWGLESAILGTHYR